jgi:hypothetical protein
VRKAGPETPAEDTGAGRREPFPGAARPDRAPGPRPCGGQRTGNCRALRGGLPPTFEAGVPVGLRMARFVRAELAGLMAFRPAGSRGSRRAVSRPRRERRKGPAPPTRFSAGCRGSAGEGVGAAERRTNSPRLRRFHRAAAVAAGGAATRRSYAPRCPSKKLMIRRLASSAEGSWYSPPAIRLRSLNTSGTSSSPWSLMNAWPTPGYTSIS